MIGAKPKLTKLSFASLDHLADGMVGDAVNKAIEQAIKDITEYGRDGKSRKIVMEVTLKSKPVGANLTFTANVNVKVILPDAKPRPTHGLIEVRGDSAEAMFNTSSASHPDQLTMFDDDDYVKCTACGVSRHGGSQCPACGFIAEDK